MKVVPHPPSAALADRLGEIAPGARGFSRPTSIDAMAELYRDLDADETTTVVIGSGTHQRMGYPVTADVGETEEFDGTSV